MENQENYIKEKKTIDLVKANLFSIAVFLPVGLFYFLPFYLIWPEKFGFGHSSENQSGFILFDKGLWPIAVSMVIFLVGIMLHELIHGITWSIYAKNGFKSIRFGILAKMLTPYCHCTEPLKVGQYITGALMPFIVLGLLPYLVSLFTSSFEMLLFGAMFTIVAAGDFMIVWLLRNESKDSCVLDHPSEAGCYVYRRKTDSDS